MRRCVIIPAWAPDGIREIVGLNGEDFIVCADGGYALAQRENILPHLLVGDFDSLGEVPNDLPPGCHLVRVPREKNETDAFLCLQQGMEAGCRSFVMAGGIGGRLDHTVAHLQILAYALEHGLEMWMMDLNNRVTMMEPGEKRIPRAEGFKLSVLSYSDRCLGVTIENVKYPLKDAELTNAFPLGISNEFEGEEALIRLKEGRLLLLLSRDRGGES
jgi:thiamine pyrophosphokinase